MLSQQNPALRPQSSLDLLDRIALAYVLLPLPIFLLGWFKLWAAIPLVALTLLALRPLGEELPASPSFPLGRTQVVVAVVLGCLWTFFGGTDHFVYANLDWFIRDAVLHDLVSAPWPVGYSSFDAGSLLLRAPLGYYMAAASVGKLLGLAAAHHALAIWTAAGAALFILQVLSLTRMKMTSMLSAGVIIIFFSGLDIVGSILNWGPRFLAYYNITDHLEWWAGSYQYSSMTTQLFWVPNHALAAWLLMGLLARSKERGSLEDVLPMTLVAAALWSPLSAVGAVPFVVLKLSRGFNRQRLASLLRPQWWLPAAVVGAFVVQYLVLDATGINKGALISQRNSTDLLWSLASLFQFFMLEAGLLGAAILLVRRSQEVMLALLVLLLLPLVRFGPGNDIVMRASIPALAVLVIGACAAMDATMAGARLTQRKAILAMLLAVGAVTPVHEFARALLLRAWPINLKANLIVASCYTYPPHYVARVGSNLLGRFLRGSTPITVSADQLCNNPAVDLLIHRGKTK